MTNLSVNLNKVALLRNARNFGRPSVIEAALTCIKAGAQGITPKSSTQSSGNWFRSERWA